MLPKRMLALTFLASALAVMPPCVLRAQWVQVNEPNGETVSFVAALGSNLFAESQQGTVFSSTDGGNNWDFLGRSDSAILPIFMIGSTSFGQNSAGIYVSTNNGSAWDWAADTNWPKGSFSYLVNESKLFAYGDGILMSPDSGKS